MTRIGVALLPEALRRREIAVQPDVGQLLPEREDDEVQPRAVARRGEHRLVERSGSAGARDGPDLKRSCAELESPAIWKRNGEMTTRRDGH